MYQEIFPKIPENFLDLFEKKSFAYLSTLAANCIPHITPVWIDYDGEYLLINSVKGRVKDRNMNERPSVALCIQDPESPYRFVSIQGTVVSISEDEANHHIDKLAHRYMGVVKYEGNPTEIRQIYKIRPEHIVTAG